MPKRAKFYATDVFRKKRENLKYTQAQIADWLSLESGEEISVYMVQKWEQKRVPMNSGMAIKIAAILETPVNELVNRG